MQQNQQTKVVVFGGPSDVSSAATSATTVDTLGMGDTCRVDVLHAKAVATNSSAKWSSLKLMEGTTTDASNHTNIVGCVGTTEATATSSQFVLGVHNNTALGGVTSFFLDLSKRARYLRVEKEASSAAYVSTANVITFFRIAEGPDEASEFGASAFVVV